MILVRTPRKPACSMILEEAQGLMLADDPGGRVTPLVVGALASLGHERVQVIPPASLAIISTGSELAPPGSALKEGIIYNSNGPMLRAFARSLGIRHVSLFFAGDSLSELERALRAAQGADMVATVGGTCRGKYDLVQEALERMGAEVVFQGVAQRPGASFLYAVGEGTTYFGLPGHPMGALICFHRYLGGALFKMMGRRPKETLWGRMAAPARVRGNGDIFLLSRVEWHEGWTVQARPSGPFSALFSPHWANAIVRVRAGDLELGQEVVFEWLEET